MNSYEIIKDEYLSGSSLTEISRKHRVSRNRISRMLQKDGVEIRKSKVRYTQDFKNKVCTRYLEEDITIRDLAEALKTCPKQISNVLKENGLFEAPKTYKYNETFFDEIDTEGKAYWLGFMYADGLMMYLQTLFNYL